MKIFKNLLKRGLLSLIVMFFSTQNAGAQGESNSQEAIDREIQELQTGIANTQKKLDNTKKSFDAYQTNKKLSKRIYSNTILVFTEVVNKLEVEQHSLTQQIQNLRANKQTVPPSLSQKLQEVERALAHQRKNFAKTLLAQFKDRIFSLEYTVKLNESNKKFTADQIEQQRAKNQAVDPLLLQKHEKRIQLLNESKARLSVAKQEIKEMQEAVNQLNAGKNFHDLPTITKWYSSYLSSNRMSPQNGLYQLIKAKRATVKLSPLKPYSSANSSSESIARNKIQEIENNPEKYPHALSYLNTYHHPFKYIGSTQDSLACRSDKEVQTRSQFAYTASKNLHDSQERKKFWLKFQPTHPKSQENQKKAEADINRAKADLAQNLEKLKVHDNLRGLFFNIFNNIKYKLSFL